MTATSRRVVTSRGRASATPTRAPFGPPNPVYEAVEALLPPARPRRGARRHARVEPARRPDRAGRPRHRQAEPRLLEEPAPEDHGREARRLQHARLAPPARARLRAPRRRPARAGARRRLAGRGLRDREGRRPARHLRRHRSPRRPRAMTSISSTCAISGSRRCSRSTTCAASAARGTSACSSARRLPGDPRGLPGRRSRRASSFFAGAGAPRRGALRFHRSHYATPVPHHTGSGTSTAFPRRCSTRMSSSTSPS